MNLEIFSKKSRVIFVDYGILIFRAFHVYRKSQLVPVTYIILSMLISSLKRIGLTQDDLVIIACDKGRSWRKEIDSSYKADRKEKREVLESEEWWKNMFIDSDIIKSRIDCSTPFYIIEENGLEADDIISFGVRYFKDNECIIISSDQDFEQLTALSNVKIFSPMSKKYKTICYSLDTEIFTENGWMLLKDLVEKHLKVKVATLNPKKGIVEYHYPINYYKYFYEGEMINFLNKKGINLLVTPNHNIFYMTSTNWKIKSAEEVFKKSYFAVSRKFKFMGGTNTLKLLPQFNLIDLIKFLGLYLSEGSFSRTYYKKKSKSWNYKIVISQEKEDVKHEIRCILKNLKIKFYESGGDFTIYDKNLVNFCAQFGKAKDKFIPTKIKHLNANYLKILLDYLIMGDGSKTKTGYYYFTVSKQLAKDVDEIALKVGFTTHRWETKLYNPKWNNIWTISLHKIYKSWINKKQKLQYCDYIYSIQIPHNLFYVRRPNGAGCWCGNSNPYKTLTKKIGEEKTDNLTSPIDNEKEYKKRLKIVSLLELPKEIEDKIKNKLDNLFTNISKKFYDLDNISFHTIRERFKNIYELEDVVKYGEIKKKRKKKLENKKLI